jgi:hypothetical protein
MTTMKIIVLGNRAQSRDMSRPWIGKEKSAMCNSTATTFHLTNPLYPCPYVPMTVLDIKTVVPPHYERSEEL